MKIKIRYIKNRSSFNIAFGILMIMVGLFAVYENNFSIYSYLWVVLGTLQLGVAWYEKKKQYLTIEDDKLTLHSLIPKSIEISKIKRIKKDTNSYKIETTEKALKIEKRKIEPESMYRLEDYFNRLGLMS